MLIIVAERGPPTAAAAAPRRVRLNDQKTGERRAVYAALVQSFSARMRLRGAAAWICISMGREGCQFQTVDCLSLKHVCCAAK